MEKNGIVGIAHIGLYTEQFEESIKFYQDAFFAKNLGCFKTSRRGCWLQIGDSILEIFESESFPAQGCFKHFAITVKDLEEAYQHALSVGAKPLVEPKEIVLDLEEKQKLKIAFVTGVNGEEIELCERIR